MKLHHKLLLSILAGLCLVSALSLSFQHTRLRTLIRQLATSNLQLEEQSQWRAIQNLQRACDIALSDAMVEGEMERFRKQLAAQKIVEGLQEITVFNKDGVAAYSTVSGVVRSKLPEAQLQRLRTETQPWRQLTADSFELYQPMPVQAACLECHANFKKVANGGLYRYRFSTAGLHEAQAQWTGFSHQLINSSLGNGLGTALMLFITTATLVTWLVRRQIARPLDHVSRTLRACALELGSAAGAIADTSNQLAQGSQAQAASLEESSASIEETSSMARRTAEDANQTQAAAAATHQAAQTASTAMDQMSTHMHGIRQASADVGKILKTIDEIAFQTNILALNAAVEAARAGEAGAGFAVVAEEVRSLAQRCAEAARTTATLVDQVNHQVQQGSAISDQVGTHLRDIVAKVEREDQLVRQIATASKEQGLGLGQINDAVAAIDKVTQQNASMSEQTAEAAGELRAQAAQLSHEVQALFCLLHGRAECAPPQPDVPAVSLAPTPAQPAAAQARRYPVLTAR